MTPSCLLKVTKFLVKMPQFEFLVITEKNIFAYKHFLSLNISYFSLFLCENCNPPAEREGCTPSNYNENEVENEKWIT